MNMCMNSDYFLIEKLDYLKDLGVDIIWLSPCYRSPLHSYTTGLQPAVLTYMISSALKKFDGKVTASEIGLPVSSNGLVLPCGASGRFESIF